MKNNKSKKIFIIIIILLAIILVVGVALAMFSSNKTDKDLFFEYASQLFSEDNGFIDNKLGQYSEKKKTSVYDHQGSFSASIDSENLDEQTLDNINQFSISFAGNNDSINSASEELVKINYSDKVNFPIQYKKFNGVNGIKFNDISKRYFTVSDDGINGLIAKLTGNDSTQFGATSETSISTVDFSSFNFTKEEKDKFKDTYLPAIKDVFDDSSFTRVTAMDSEGYTLQLTNEKFKEVIIKILETLKNDEQMLDKLSSISGTTVSSTDIDSLISNLQSMEITDGNSIITVYQNNKKLNKIEIQFNDQIKLTISKKSDDDTVSYQIDAEGQDYSVNLSLNYAGLQNLEQINETYTLSINLGSTGASYSYNIENKVNFAAEDVQIDDFTDGEYIDLNNLNAEKLNQVLQTIIKGIQKVNENKLKEAGVGNMNPIISIIPGMSETLGLYSSANNVLVNATDQMEEQSKQLENERNQISNETNTVADTTNTTSTNQIDNTTTTNSTNEVNTNSSSTSDLVSGMEQVTKESFNNRFKQYESENATGSAVKSLLMQVIANNLVDDQRKIEVTGDIKLTGSEVPDTVVATKKYKVKCSMDSDGYVNKVEITENK